MIEIMGKVREQGLFWFQLAGHLNCFVQTEVRDMTPPAERIQDEQVEPFQKCHALCRNLVRVCAVGNIPDTETKHIKAWTMFQANRDDRCSQYFKWLGPDAVKFQLRGRPGMGRHAGGKGIIKGRANTLLHALLAVKRHGMPKVELEQPQVIQAKDVICMLMREQDAVDHPNLFP